MNETLIGIQEQYITKLNGARNQATNYKKRAAVRLIEAQAYKGGVKQLLGLGFNLNQADGIMRDARDMADLEMEVA